VTGGPSRAPRRILLGLLLADALLGWMAVQASFVFLELVWRAAAGRENWAPLLMAHVRQFAILRAADAVALGATVVVFAAWLRGVRGALASTGRLVAAASGVRPLRMMLETWRAAVPGAATGRAPALVLWWWAVVLATLVAKGWAAARLLATGAPVDLGRGLALTILGGGLQIALAVLTIFVVVTLQGGAPAGRRTPR
jgi:hypothetical protein